LNISFYKEVPYEGDSFGRGWQGLLMFIVGLTQVWSFLIMIECR